MTYDEVGTWFGRTYPPGAVVLGYNGTAHAENALLWAVDEAERLDVPLVVVYAANYPGMTVEPGPGLLHRDPGALAAAQEVTARGVALAVAARPGLRVVGATEVESPTRALVDAEDKAALVVLGSRGYGRVVGSLLGSVAFAVAAKAPCPVIIVKNEGADRRPGPDHRVVVGTDGSPPAQAAVRFAASRAASCGAAVEVVTSTGGHLVEDVDEAQLRAGAERIATDAAAAVLRAHPSVHVTTRIKDCPAERTLVDASADAGLLVVGTRGRGAFRGMLLGSVSHAVIHGATCAVAVVDEDAERPSGG